MAAISSVSIGSATGAVAPGPRRPQGPMKEEKEKKKKQLSRIATCPVFVNEIAGSGLVM